MVIESGRNEKVYYHRFIVYQPDDMDNPIFTSTAEYRTRDRLIFLWDEYGNIRVYTADMGIYAWMKDGNMWMPQYPTPDDESLLIQEIRDKYLD